jgi:hypothetical protein
LKKKIENTEKDTIIDTEKEASEVKTGYEQKNIKQIGLIELNRLNIQKLFKKERKA